METAFFSMSSQINSDHYGEDNTKGATWLSWSDWQSSTNRRHRLCYCCAGFLEFQDQFLSLLRHLSWDDFALHWLVCPTEKKSGKLSRTSSFGLVPCGNAELLLFHWSNCINQITNRAWQRQRKQDTDVVARNTRVKFSYSQTIGDSQC